MTHDDPQLQLVIPDESRNFDLGHKDKEPCPACDDEFPDLERRATWKTGKTIVMYRLKCGNPRCDYATALMKDPRSALRAWRVASIVAR